MITEEGEGGEDVEMEGGETPKISENAPVSESLANKPGTSSTNADVASSSPSKTAQHSKAEDAAAEKMAQDAPEEGKKPYGGKKGKRGQEDANVQFLGDKVRYLSNIKSPLLMLALQGVADVAEAIIGAAYITAGRELALRVTKAMNIPVPHIDRWTDFARKTLAPPPDVSAPLKEGTVEHIESAIGHSFKRPHLLAQALVDRILILFIDEANSCL